MDLMERVGVLEDVVGAPAPNASSLAEQANQHETLLREMQVEIGRNLEGMTKRHDDMLRQMMELANRIEERFVSLEDDVKLLKRDVANRPASGDGPNPKLRVPEPKQFGGTRSAKELENFLWDMEQYFRAARVAETEQVTITSMFLIGDAKLWWRTRLDDDASAGRPRIETWDVLKKELRDQFLPLNSAWVARESLKGLKHTGLVRDYVKEFSSLMLDIKNMSEEDKLFNFISGLQPWAQAELRRQNVKDLPTAIAAADSLIDYKLGPSSSWEKKKPEQGEKSKNGGSKEKRDGKRVVDSTMPKGTDQPQGKTRNFTGCFLCAGPHRARDCPVREKLNAMVTQEGTDNEGEDDSEGVTRVNPIQVINTIASLKGNGCKSLMYVTVGINGFIVRALLDTGASNNFMSRGTASTLGLSVMKDSTRFKAVNSQVQSVQGIATSVMKIGDWERECSFMILPLDDFDLILGMEFFIKSKAAVAPHLGGLLIFDEGSPCFVKVEKISKGGKTGQVGVKGLTRTSKASSGGGFLDPQSSVSR